MLRVVLTLAALTAGPATTVRDSAWRLISISADQRTLKVVYEGGGCARADGKAVVTSGERAVRIHIRQTVVDDPYVACAAIYAFLPLRVHLGGRLAGRLITGGPHMQPTLLATRVPRLVGLRVRDARRALAGQELTARLRGRGRIVRAQRPRPGARVPASRAVTLRVRR